MLRINISGLAFITCSRMTDRFIGVSAIFTLLLLFFTWAEPAGAQNTAVCEPETARVTSVQGEVEIRWNQTEPWQPANLEDVLCTGTTIRVGAYSRAALVFVDDSTLRLDQSTTLVIRGREQERRTWLEMIKGAIHFFSHRPRSLNVETPFVNAAAEGTEFLIRVGEEEAHILMYEGIVLASNEAGELRLGPDDAALIEKGRKPVPEIVIRPRDAVAWAVYVPDVFSDLAAGAEPGAYPVHLQVALKWARDNNIPVALRTLDLVPADERDASHEALRAAILLTVGRFDEAEAAIARALALDEDAADAYAVRTIIHVTRNERAQALRDADRAVQLAPNSSTALIAQSYARQAGFDLEGARGSLRSAVDKNPNDALAYARLAEIELSFADYDRANEAAKQATTLAPNLARTQTVLGFSKLAEIDTDAARKAFARAIAQNSADPLPHLGFGLATIRDGFLEAGRRDLEIAASLAPNNALIRSYLGKAYFEEKRGPKDATQFDIAKKLDPNDPTPWFYDAIKKQTENRPVEALRDLEKAIALNDNRAVYRSSLLLDQDRATRAVSLARIYDDLGFEQLAVNEASISVSRSPADHSAHRFLSDAYARLPRHEIARASNLRQAKLLQPININPLQPSLSIVDLSGPSSAGPSEITFNEFNPLFERDRMQLTLSGAIGSDDTIGKEVSASGILNNFSFSAGQLLYKTDGFRDNNDGEDKAYNFFAQFAISPKLSLQAEFLDRDSEFGDLFLNFDLDNFSENNRFARDRKEISLGGSLDITPENKMVFSFSSIDQQRKNVQFFDDDSFSSIVSEDGIDLHIQNYFQKEKTALLVGINIYKSTGDLEEILTIGAEEFSTIDDVSTNGQNGYIYAFFDPISAIRTTLGVSYDRIEEDFFKERKLNPKVGLEWDVLDYVKFRSAFFRNTKRRLVTDTTLEHTTIAGFNQFFDDLNGTTTDTFGIGFDFLLPLDIKAGFSFQERRRREIRRIFTADNAIETRKNKEEIFGSYFYVPISESWSFFLEPTLTLFDSESEFDPAADIRTASVPLGLRYFDANGIFWELRGEYINQEFESVDGEIDDDDFLVVDTSIGWKFPGRIGSLKIEARNILNQSFQYQDDNFLSVETYRSRLSPDPSILARLTVNF